MAENQIQLTKSVNALRAQCKINIGFMFSQLQHSVYKWLNGNPFMEKKSTTAVQAEHHLCGEHVYDCDGSIISEIMFLSIIVLWSAWFSGQHFSSCRMILSCLSQESRSILVYLDELRSGVGLA